MTNYLFLILLVISIFSFRKVEEQEPVPVYFEEYHITIRAIKALGDTLSYKKSSKEDFKLVFYDTKGKCYLERYIYGKLSERGYYENSLDTLKQYISGRYSNGNSTPIRVMKYFQPLKSGSWLTYEAGRIIKEEKYIMGVQQ